MPKSETEVSELSHGDRSSGAVVDHDDPMCRDNTKSPTETGDEKSWTGEESPCRW